ncbi:phosphatase 2C-like domain-containing protein [Protomyces lactucae-debilis]|uniref:Protein phosphatase n=1 Tax=Protomyces lactucae-debilis TaxID=2754530 RepID=A0A1Y2FDK4_PROLT|nr:phosphatase 2C-like domain-containing protein [Protomyces lactucae-debilis]ORY82002.1 phosphatase 2C-like domain-containing protein [Protomyces lactucae-debilis]
MPTAPSPKGDFTTTSMSDPMSKGERMLKDDGAEVEYQGSTTLLVGYLPPESHQLHVVNIGDSSLMQIRQGTVLFETEPQSHWFDCPFQIGHNSPDTPQKSADLTSLDLQEGDMLVTSTDGLGDNVYPAQILTVIAEEQRSALKDTEEAQQDDLNRISARLVTLAREKMADEWGESPFGDKAICEGIGFMGGKKDDVSILVTKVVRA